MPARLQLSVNSNFLSRQVGARKDTGQRSDGSHVLMDSHVHFHSCFDQTSFWDMAALNFREATLRLSLGPYFTGVLMLTEASGKHYFAKLRTDVEQQSTDSGWRFCKTSEESSLVAHRDGNRLVVIAGRQVQTRENLEVLILGCCEAVLDGLTLAEVVGNTCQKGALAVLPWGFGKWTFGRGQLIKQFLQSANRNNLYIGDNAGRPRCFGPPALFDLATTKGLFILPGSDPFPFSDEIAKAGSFGCVLEGELDSNKPFESLKTLLQRSQSQPLTYGCSSNLALFFWNQLRLRLRAFRRLCLV